MIYTPPLASQHFLARLDLSTAVPVAEDFVAAVKHVDESRAKNDPSMIAALLQFPGKQVLWDAKLAVDADGVDGVKLDPSSGQNDTTWHFANGSPLDSRIHPYVVLPGGIFRPRTWLALGDVCVVIYKNQITGAMFGDVGPGLDLRFAKLGEASIRVHEGLSPAAPECCHRDSDGKCIRIIDSSIEHSVIVVGFPNSSLPHADLTPDNLEEQTKAHAYTLFAAMGGSGLFKTASDD